MTCNEVVSEGTLYNGWVNYTCQNGCRDGFLWFNPLIKTIESTINENSGASINVFFADDDSTNPSNIITKSELTGGRNARDVNIYFKVDRTKSKNLRVVFPKDKSSNGKKDDGTLTYPAPFIVGGQADVAIVYGTGTGAPPTDLVQAGNIQTHLQSYTLSAGLLGGVLVKDFEVSAISSHNLIVVGNSCYNSVAATLVGGAYCGFALTVQTGIGAGQWLIASYESPWQPGKVVLLVAGYEAADTINATTYLRTHTINIGVGKKYKGTSATSATLLVE